VPEALSAQLSIIAACDIAAPNVNAQLTALASFQPSILLQLTDMLALAAQIVANVQAAISAIPPIPVLSLDAQIALAASITVDLNTMLGIIDVQMAFAVSLGELLATGGVHLLAYSGPNNALGGELAAALGGGTAQTWGVLMITQSSATWTAMQTMFKTS
jgi:hypothetical protein